MFSRLARRMTAQVTDLEDILGVAALFFILFLGLTLSGAA